MPKPLTILFASSHNDWSKFAQATLRQARTLKSRGHRLLFGCRAGTPIEERAKHYKLQVLTDFKFPGAFPRKNLWRECRLMARIIDIEVVDAVHAHGGPESWIAGVGTRLASRGPAVVRTMHSMVNPVSGLFGRLIQQGLIDHLVISCGAVYEQLRLVSDFNPDLASLIYSGVDLKRFNPSVDGMKVRQEFKIAPDAPLVVVAGPDEPSRGFDVFFQAFAEVLKKCPKARALGAFADTTEDQRAALAVRAEKAGVPAETLAITGSRPDLENILAATDVVAVPNTEPVSPSRLALEAMAAGRPVVGSSVAGITDFVQGGVTGELVAPGDASALAEGLSKLLGDRKAGLNQGLSGRLCAEQQFSEDLSAEQLEDLYARIIEDHGGADGGFEG